MAHRTSSSAVLYKNSSTRFNTLMQSGFTAQPWAPQGACTREENAALVNGFFSRDPAERYPAKNLCFSQCPVREDCLRWALEHRQIWGVWGGKDEGEIRRALSVGASGEETRRRRSPNCPFCTARPSQLVVVEYCQLGKHRRRVVRVVECMECKFSWRSRTSASAVDAYWRSRRAQASQPRRSKIRAKAPRAQSKTLVPLASWILPSPLFATLETAPPALVASARQSTYDGELDASAVHS